MGGKSKSGGGGTTWSTGGGKSAKKPSKSKANAKSSAGAAGSKKARSGSSPHHSAPVAPPVTANGNGHSINGSQVDSAGSATGTTTATAPLPATGIELIGKVIVFKHDPLSHDNPRIHPPPKPTLNPSKYLLFDSPSHFADYARDPRSPQLTDDDTVLVITSDLVLHLAVGRDVTYYVWDDFGFMQHERKHHIKTIRECVIQNFDLLHVGKRDVDSVMSLYDPKHVLTQIAAMVCVPGGTLYEKGKRGKAFAGLVGRVVKLRPEYMVIAQSINNPTHSPSLLRDPAKTLLLPTSTTYESVLAAARLDELVVHLTEPYLASCATLILASVLDRDTIPPPVVIGSSVQFSVPAPRGAGMDANEHGAVVELEDRQSVLDMVALAEQLRAKQARRAPARAAQVTSTRERMSLLATSQEAAVEEAEEESADVHAQAVPLAVN